MWFSGILLKENISPHSKSQLNTTQHLKAQQQDLSCSWLPPRISSSYYRSCGDFNPLFADNQQTSCSLHIFRTPILTVMCFLSHSFVAIAMCFESLSCWNTHPPPWVKTTHLQSPGWSKISLYLVPFSFPRPGVVVLYPYRRKSAKA